MRNSKRKSRIVAGIAGSALAFGLAGNVACDKENDLHDLGKILRVVDAITGRTPKVQEVRTQFNAERRRLYVTPITELIGQFDIRSYVTRDRENYEATDEGVSFDNLGDAFDLRVEANGKEIYLERYAFNSESGTWEAEE